MRAAHSFIEVPKSLKFDAVAGLHADSFCSLGATGKCHGSNNAVPGLTGELSETADTKTADSRLPRRPEAKKIPGESDESMVRFILTAAAFGVRIDLVRLLKVPYGGFFEYVVCGHPVAEGTGQFPRRNPHLMALGCIKHLAWIITVRGNPEYGGVRHGVFDKAGSDDPSVMPDFHQCVDQRTPFDLLAWRCPFGSLETFGHGRGRAGRCPPQLPRRSRGGLGFDRSQCSGGLHSSILHVHGLCSSGGPGTHLCHVIPDLRCEFIRPMETSLGADMGVQSYLDSAAVQITGIVQKMGFKEPGSFTVIGRTTPYRDGRNIGPVLPFGPEANRACPDAIPDFPVRNGEVGRGVTKLTSPRVTVFNYALKPDGAPDSCCVLGSGIACHVLTRLSGLFRALRRG